MEYICEICNYSTDRLFCLNRHKHSTKHIEKVNEYNKLSINNQKSNEKSSSDQKYKAKYLNLKGGTKSWLEQEKDLIEKLKKELPELILEKNIHLNEPFIELIKSATGQNIKKNITKEQLIKIIHDLSLRALSAIINGEKLGLLKKNKETNVDKAKMDEYIKDKKFTVSYSTIKNGKVNFNNHSDIYAIHSVGKVFTGFLVILMIKEGIISKNNLGNPIKLDKQVLNKLSNEVKKRLDETTLLDVMTHKSGLKDYLGNYFDGLSKGITDGNIPDLQEPEDFLDYADKDVVDKDKFHYSSLGLLLVGLSAKYYYNKHFEDNKSYNEILKDYILDPSNVKTFSVSMPKKGVYNKAHEIMKYTNGSPAGGYWMSSRDLRKVGEFIFDKCQDKNIVELLERYGGEFFKNNEIYHSGGIRHKEWSSTAEFYISLPDGTIVAIMGLGNSASNLFNAMKLCN